jgi:hypothetical protein
MKVSDAMCAYKVSRVMLKQLVSIAAQCRSSVFNLTTEGCPMRYMYIVIDRSLLIIQILALLCAFARPAYAYVDPGSGLFALQTFSTTIAGIVFLIRRNLRRLFGIRHASKKCQIVDRD